MQHLSLRCASVGAGALPLAACGKVCGRSRGAAHAQSLEPAAWATVEAATARLIPTDDLPGAREANVVGFIDRQLALPHFAVFKDEFRVGVGVLDVLADFSGNVAKHVMFLTKSGAAADFLLSSVDAIAGLAARHPFLGRGVRARPRLPRA